MSEGTLFELPGPQERAAAAPTRPEEARVLRPVRQQLQWVARDLEATVPQDHPVQAIWGLLEEMDLSAFYGSIKAVLDRTGRPTTDPPGAAGPSVEGPALGPPLSGAGSGWKSAWRWRGRRWRGRRWHSWPRSGSTPTLA